MAGARNHEIRFRDDAGQFPKQLVLVATRLGSEPRDVVGHVDIVLDRLRGEGELKRPVGILGAR